METNSPIIGGCRLHGYLNVSIFGFVAPCFCDYYVSIFRDNSIYAITYARFTGCRLCVFVIETVASLQSRSQAAHISHIALIYENDCSSCSGRAAHLFEQGQ